MSNSLMNTYARLPVSFVKGEGAWLWDTEGNRYLDAISGIAVCNLGHAHPAITKAISEQAAQLVHTSNLYGIPNQEALAAALTKESCMDNVFFSNSGAEANEAAIKLARLHGHNQGIEKPAIIVMDNSFHGRTMATLTATGNRKVHAGFEPLLSGFVRVPYNDIEAIERVAANNSNIVAVLVEPVQGEGGVNIPAGDYLPKIRQLCDQHNWLMMLDEIQTGFGRTGKLFAFQHHNFIPDVMTLAKGLGNGFPIGACLAHGKAASCFQPGNHGSTFGGNPLGCKVGLTVLETMKNEKSVDRAKQLGELMLNSFKEKLGQHSSVANIRQQGLMIGIELHHPCAELVSEALENGLLINVTAEKVIRLLPPFILSDEEAQQIVDGVCKLIENLSAKAA